MALKSDGPVSVTPEVSASPVTVAHTPGPWVAIPSRTRWHGDSKPLFADGLWHILPADRLERVPICSVDHADDHHPPCRWKAEADARLIAVAPELLEACRKALEFADLELECRESGAEDEVINEAREMVEQLKAVIAKAEGRS